MLQYLILYIVYVQYCLGLFSHVRLKNEQHGGDCQVACAVKFDECSSHQLTIAHLCMQECMHMHAIAGDMFPLNMS